MEMLQTLLFLDKISNHLHKWNAWIAKPHLYIILNLLLSTDWLNVNLNVADVFYLLMHRGRDFLQKMCNSVQLVQLKSNVDF